ncbi:MAG TPA: aminopeptidase N, partial [Segeticoccus sp.]|nr:aminopeptidase N [Segeticoccus sp.]
MPGKNLTRAEARERGDLLTVSSYDVTLDLTTGPTAFRTTSTVRFEAAEEGAETFIDLIAESVRSITLNGTALDPSTHFDGARVRLPGLQGSNELVVDA